MTRTEDPANSSEKGKEYIRSAGGTLTLSLPGDDGVAWFAGDTATETTAAATTETTATATITVSTSGETKRAQFEAAGG